MEQADAAAIRSRAEHELKKLPGVVGVGFGRKEVDGRTTDEPALRVYVMEKKPLDELDPAAVVPAEFEGIATDVVIVKSGRAHPCVDQEQHRPLVGGIVITNFKLVNNQYSEGTLGFFATIDGVAGPENVVAVSNNHVLMDLGAAVGDDIFQPQFETVNGITSPVQSSGYIGKIHNSGKQGYHEYTYPNEAKREYYVDCATAKLNICISSWCHTNCGVSYKNEVRGLNIGGNSKIEGFVRISDAEAAAPGQYVVYKVGRTTSRTKGDAKDAYGTVNLNGVLKHGVLIVEPIEPDCDSIMQFSAHGDSGSPVVNEQNKLVGILFGGANDGSQGWVSHIHPVLDLLKVTPISTLNPPVGPAGQARADAHGFFDGVNETIPLRERFLRTAVGQRVHDAVLVHREEVVGLVNRKRPVTVAWHRAKGPAFVAHLVENMRNPAHRVPREIDGVDRATLARKIAAALAQHGSAAVAAAVDEWLPFVLEHLCHTDDLHALVSRFEPEPANA